MKKMTTMIPILCLILLGALCYGQGQARTENEIEIEVAQDTITGVVNRVDAPYFEQNVCDSRFVITMEGETYYIMVDGYWPNPYLEDLVIHYDTISVGNEIEVVGNILEMEDGNGDIFQAIDISENLNSTYQQIMMRVLVSIII